MKHIDLCARCKMDSDLVEFLKTELDPAYYPTYFCGDINSVDINILGADLFHFIIDQEGDWNWYGYSKDKARIFSQELTWEVYNEYYGLRSPLYKWTHWLTQKVFHPNVMVYESIATQKVRLRIAVSQLNKMKIPGDLNNKIFDHLIACFYYRKKVYTDFLYKEILKLPFY